MKARIQRDRFGFVSTMLRIVDLGLHQIDRQGLKLSIDSPIAKEVCKSPCLPHRGEWHRHYTCSSAEQPEARATFF